MKNQFIEYALEDKHLVNFKGEMLRVYLKLSNLSFGLVLVLRSSCLVTQSLASLELVIESLACIEFGFKSITFFFFIFVIVSISFAL